MFTKSVILNVAHYSGGSRRTAPFFLVENPELWEILSAVGKLDTDGTSMGVLESVIRSPGTALPYLLISIDGKNAIMRHQKGTRDAPVFDGESLLKLDAPGVEGELEDVLDFFKSEVIDRPESWKNLGFEPTLETLEIPNRVDFGKSIVWEFDPIGLTIPWKDDLENAPLDAMIWMYPIRHQLMGQGTHKFASTLEQMLEKRLLDEKSECSHFFQSKGITMDEVRKREARVVSLHQQLNNIYYRASESLSFELDVFLKELSQTDACFELVIFRFGSRESSEILWGPVFKYIENHSTRPTGNWSEDDF